MPQITRLLRLDEPTFPESYEQCLQLYFVHQEKWRLRQNKIEKRVREADA